LAYLLIFDLIIIDSLAVTIHIFGVFTYSNHYQ